MTARQFGQWFEFYKSQPFGEFKRDYRAGIIASNITNVNLQKDAKPFAPTDFMPFNKRQERQREAELTPEQERDLIVGLLNPIKQE